MSTNSNIEWTEVTWNPLAGCDKISAGCRECYAIRMAWRLMHIEQIGDKYAGTVEKTAGGKLNWTGKINFDFKALYEPLGWKGQKMVFVNSMSDLFHKDVPVSFIALVFAVMFHSKHTYQLLTKRADRANTILNSEEFKQALVKAINDVHRTHIDDNETPAPFNAPNKPDAYDYEDVMQWYPLKNVWIGVSVEDQKAADERIPQLLNTPAAVRWLSCEPLLGPVKLDEIELPFPEYRLGPSTPANINCLTTMDDEHYYNSHNAIDWVVVGGESGADARPMHPQWVNNIRMRCSENGVPFFFKQWGSYLPFEDTAQPPFIRACNNNQEFDAHLVNFIDKETGKPGKWCNGQWMEALEAQMYCVEHGSIPVMFLKKMKGKKAFAALYGKQYKEYPNKHTVK